jgi:lipopolysaccharide transport system permease protein
MRARSWHLILQFALKDFKIRYTHSVLGYAWSILNPLVFALVYYFVAPLHVRYHDVGYLWGLAVQGGFWLTPIIYQEVMIPPRWHWLITYNPMARIILYSRQVVIYGVWPNWTGLLKTSLAAVLVLAVGWATFQRQQARLVEQF